MKVVITHLKAPWPAGAAVGDVVDLVDCAAIPGWAAGKCEAAADDATAAHVWAKPVPAATEPAPSDADELRATQALLTEARIEADELRARVAKAEEALAQRDAELTEARAALAKAEEALAAKAAGGKAGKG